MRFLIAMAACSLCLFCDLRAPELPNDWDGCLGSSCWEKGPCDPNPCLNNGTCAEDEAVAICTCEPGFSGSRCHINDDDCYPNPCENGGQCIDGINSYACECTKGFEGATCEINSDDCTPNPCLNEGVCEDGIGTFTCNCTAGYVGKTCESLYDHCTPNPCQHGGTCSSSTEGPACECAPGYTGATCELNIDECADEPCLNDGTCKDLLNGFECSCSAGFEGMTCEIDIDDCDPNPCQHGGECIDQVNGFSCSCPAGYDGKTCSHNINECTPNPCENGGICTDLLGGFSCLCVTGFEGDTCSENVDDCAPNPCLNGGVCTDGMKNFTCKCAPGYSGDICEVEANDCVPNPCMNGGKCIEEQGSFSCECPPDYTGKLCTAPADAGTCSPNPCQNGGICNLVNNQPECTCPQETAGSLCETILSNCSPGWWDINGDGSSCTPMITAGYITASNDVTCQEAGTLSGAWYDCGRDGQNANCSPLGGVWQASWCSAQASIGPLDACRCIYGAAIDWAAEHKPNNANGCPVIRCAFAPTQGMPSPLPACQESQSSITNQQNDYDWQLPQFAQTHQNSGFYTRFGESKLDAHVIDLCWNQLHESTDCLDSDSAPCTPDTPGCVCTDTFTQDKAVTLLKKVDGSSWDVASYNEQLSTPHDFWMRLFISRQAWGPDWIVSACNLTPSDLVSVASNNGPVSYLPVWNPCVWAHIKNFYRKVFIDWNLRADPRLKFVYVAGAFPFGTYDYGVIASALAEGSLTFEDYDAWFKQAMLDLVNIFNGENDDATDDYAHKLVFTGQDYPSKDPFGANDDMYAKKAVTAGMGIRHGSTENFNNHLNHLPAYGNAISDDGHVTSNHQWELFDGKRIIGAENECYPNCEPGNDAMGAELHHAVVMANLKALQMRVNWLYVNPKTSYMDTFQSHWDWVRLSLGHSANTSPDAWVALREANDTSWAYAPSEENTSKFSWLTRPWVKNMSRWLVQKDVAPDGVSRRGATVVYGNLFSPGDKAANISYEGRQTDVAYKQDTLYFDINDTFAASLSGKVEIKVTYMDSGQSEWHIAYLKAGCRATTQPVQTMGSGLMKTITFTLPDATWSNGLAGETDFAIRNKGPDDIDVRFVRVVRM